MLAKFDEALTFFKENDFATGLENPRQKRVGFWRYLTSLTPDQAETLTVGQDLVGGREPMAVVPIYEGAGPSEIELDPAEICEAGNRERFVAHAIQRACGDLAEALGLPFDMVQLDPRLTAT